MMSRRARGGRTRGGSRWRPWVLAVLPAAVVACSAASSPAGTRPAGAPSCTAGEVLARWSDARLAAQTLAAPADEGDLGAAGATVAAGIGGLVLFGSSAPDNLAAQLQAVERRAPGQVAPLVMTDEEGGAVQRMANLVGEVPAPRTLGATRSPAAIEQLAVGLGRRLRAAGVTMDLAPVADVDGGPGPSNRDPDGTRSFSAATAVAAADAVAFAQGLRSGGVIPVLKHFPGLGGASGNTDVMRASTLPWPEERAKGLPPFERAIAAGLPAIMVSNATVPGLSSLPASLSPAVVTGVLRHQLHFSGLVLTDSLSAVAIRAAGYPLPRAAVAALAAGDDLLLYGPLPVGELATATHQMLAGMVGAVRSGALQRSRLVAAAGRVLAAKGVALCPSGAGAAQP